MAKVFHLAALPLDGESPCAVEHWEDMEKRNRGVRTQGSPPSRFLKPAKPGLAWAFARNISDDVLTITGILFGHGHIGEWTEPICGRPTTSFGILLLSCQCIHLTRESAPTSLPINTHRQTNPPPLLCPKGEGHIFDQEAHTNEIQHILCSPLQLSQPNRRSRYRVPKLHSALRGIP